jgi:hypothetical protein
VAVRTTRSYRGVNQYGSGGGGGKGGGKKGGSGGRKGAAKKAVAKKAAAKPGLKSKKLTQAQAIALGRKQEAERARKAKLYAVAKHAADERIRKQAEKDAVAEAKRKGTFGQGSKNGPDPRFLQIGG